MILERERHLKKDRVEKMRGNQWILAIRRETAHWVVVKDVSASEYPVKETLYAFAAGLGSVAVIGTAWPDVSVGRWMAAAGLAAVSILLFRNQRNALTLLEASTENGVGRIDFRERLILVGHAASARDPTTIAGGKHERD